MRYSMSGGLYLGQEYLERAPVSARKFHPAESELQEMTLQRVYVL